MDFVRAHAAFPAQARKPVERGFPGGEVTDRMFDLQGRHPCEIRRVAANVKPAKAFGTHAMMHGRMDWNDLRYFLAACRHGSLAGAARELGCEYTTVEIGRASCR